MKIYETNLDNFFKKLFSLDVPTSPVVFLVQLKSKKVILQIQTVCHSPAQKLF